jgi:hypothetical protein
MKTIECSAVGGLSRRMVLQSATILALTPMMGQAQAQLALSTAFNRTVRNRVLSQRLAKSYCQILLGVLPEFSNKVLLDVRQQVRKGFDELSTAPLPAELASRIAEIKKLAEASDAMAVLPPTRETVSAVALQSDKVMAATNATAEVFRKGREGRLGQADQRGRSSARIVPTDCPRLLFDCGQTGRQGFAGSDES